MNPEHLFLGSNADNMADKIAKGRARVAIGEAAGSAKITADEARMILIDPRPYAVIAHDFGLAASTIGNIKNTRSWKHISVTPVKGRHRGNARRGISEKLNEHIIRDIRSSSETGKALAERYGVSPQCICDIRKRRSWKHID